MEKQLDASRNAELERQAALGEQSPRCAAQLQWSRPVRSGFLSERRRCCGAFAVRLRWGEGLQHPALLSPLCNAQSRFALIHDGTGVRWVAFQCEQNRLFQAEGQRNQFRARHAPRQAAHTSAFR